MGLFSMLFPKTSVNQATSGYFDTLTTYQPRFITFNGGVYEASLCRSAIHSFATQCSKLDLAGGNRTIKKVLMKPNEWQTTSQFLYQLATILECENTAFIFPRMNPQGNKIIGLHCISPTQAEVRQLNGRLYLRVNFVTGKIGMIELDRVGILTKYQYKKEFFGTNDNVLKPTLDLIMTQNQAIVEGVKNSASIRFIAKVAQTLKPKDIEEERKRFVESNLSTSNNGGVMMFDAKYSDVKQINSEPFVVGDKQMELINENVYTFFGTNRDIVLNKFTEEQWNAYYEGKIEPFAIQLSQVLTNMFANDLYGDVIVASANRLQYASNATKLNIVTQLMDRGMLTPNEGRMIFNMEGFGDEGDKRYIRLEYTEADKLAEAQGMEEGEQNANEGQ